MQRYLRGQIWWCKNTYDVNTGEREFTTQDKQKLFDHIQKGMRPVLIISNDTGNKFSETLQVIPLTSAEKITLPTHCSLYINKVKNTFLCEQAKTINKSDLTAYMISLDNKEMEMVEECIQVALGLKKTTKYEKIVLGVESGEKSIIINKEGKNEEGVNRNSEIHDRKDQ